MAALPPLHGRRADVVTGGNLATFYAVYCGRSEPATWGMPKQPAFIMHSQNKPGGTTDIAEHP